jgi:outer membrane protein assembly factor BamD (BamD/ComL family)
MKVAIFDGKISLFFLLVSALAGIGFSGCKSAPVVITDNMTSQELIQKGQDAYQNNDDGNALKYYQAVIDRYGSDKAVYVEARYEIGHLYMKQQKYKEAEPIFTEIQEIFRSSLPGTLPAAYNKLAEIELAKIPSNKKPAAQESQSQNTSETPDVY